MYSIKHIVSNAGDLYGLGDCSKDDEYDAKKNEITEQERGTFSCLGLELSNHV